MNYTVHGVGLSHSLSHSFLQEDGLLLSYKSLSLQSLTHGVGLPGSSAGQESACNAGDPSSIPGLGRSPGKGKGYPL